jgi:hypothetical protein
VRLALVVVIQTRGALAKRAKHELLPLAQLAKGAGGACSYVAGSRRYWSFEVHFSVRSVFGRSIRFASRAAGQEFLQAPDVRRIRWLWLPCFPHCMS